MSYRHKALTELPARSAENNILDVDVVRDRLRLPRLEIAASVGSDISSTFTAAETAVDNQLKSLIIAGYNQIGGRIARSIFPDKNKEILVDLKSGESMDSDDPTYYTFEIEDFIDNVSCIYQGKSKTADDSVIIFDNKGSADNNLMREGYDDSGICLRDEPTNRTYLRFAYDYKIGEEYISYYLNYRWWQFRTPALIVVGDVGFDRMPDEINNAVVAFVADNYDYPGEISSRMVKKLPLDIEAHIKYLWRR